jgi:hypothetical protein
MKKIVSLFQRNYDGDRLVRDEVVSGAEWVINGEGVPTEKIDGTSCLFQNRILWKRYDAKNGKTPPNDFHPAQDPDPKTGHWPGWVPCKITDPSDRWHWEAFENHPVPFYEGRTYELIGPKVQGNKYGLEHHALSEHGTALLFDVPQPVTFDVLREFFITHNIEGIVWHHDDGRMVKIKKKDFGFKW